MGKRLLTYEEIQSVHCDKSRGTEKGSRIFRNIGEVSKFFSIEEPILCVGCGDGLEVEAWKLLGYTVKGVEVDQKKTKIAIEHNCDVVRCLIEEYNPSEKANIFCSHTLEHCKNKELILNKFVNIALSTICIIVPIERFHTKNPSHFSQIKSLSELKLDWTIVMCVERYNNEPEGVKIWKRL